MAAVLHSAPRFASNEGVRQVLATALGDMLLASKEEHGEYLDRRHSTHTEFSRLLAEHGLFGAGALVLLLTMGLTSVLRVEDGEISRVAERLGVTAEQAVRDRVKGPGPQPPHVGAHEPLDASDHLSRGAVRERDEKDSRRRDARLDDARNAIGNGSGLPGACSGDDQLRSVSGCHDAILLVVERLPIVDQKARRRVVFDRVPLHRGRIIRQR